jgi:hypothetical protein
MEKLVLLSKETGIHLWMLKEACYLPLDGCNATTAEEAKQAFEYKPRFSEAKQAAWLKWNELSLKQAREAVTEEEVLAAFAVSPRLSKAQQVALIKLAKLAKTFLKALHVYRISPSGSEGSHAALRRMVELYEPKH